MLKALLLLLLAAPAGAVNYTLAITTSGPIDTAAIITSTPSGIVCPGTCSASFLAGSTITIGEVTPSSMSFVGWGAPCLTNLHECDLTLTAHTTITAKYAPLLKVSFSGIGVGHVNISSQAVFSSSGSAMTRTYVYPAGSSIVLPESTGAYSSFVGWTGDPNCSRASTCTITLNGYQEITATFTASSAIYPLKVTIPLGGGTVTSSPAGILCPTVCNSTFTANAAVTLTTAALAGYRFAGWANGGCNGITTCVVTSTSPLQGIGGRFSPAAFFYSLSQ